MLPIGIHEAWPDPSIEVRTMTGHADLRVNFLPAFKVAKADSGGSESNEQSWVDQSVHRQFCA